MMRVSGDFCSYWSESYGQFMKGLKTGGGMTPKQYGQRLKKSKKKTKRIKRGK